MNTKILEKIFGDPNKKVIAELRAIAESVSALEATMKQLSDDQLKAKKLEFQERLTTGVALDELLPEAFAVVREVATRQLGQRHYDVQLMGGVSLHRGQISEMRTGEGKTLVATAPTYLNALAGKGVHIITVNDYLAKRDAVWMGQVYHALGLSIGIIEHNAAYVYDPDFQHEEETDITRDQTGSYHVEQRYLRPVTRQQAYAADITYGTNNEFGFDYLRDNMVQRADQMVQRPLSYAIIDEVDSILIDEARTPLIISAPDMQSSQDYQRFAQIVPQLNVTEHYTIDEKLRSVILTQDGIARVEQLLGMENLYVEGGVRLVHHLEQALRAHALYRLDRDYVVKDGEVMIVDEFTGRLMAGRRFSEGLHQALEAKERVKVKEESRTMATITFQNLFRLYDKIAGMTGTAATEAEEFGKIYGLEVVSIPPNKLTRRSDLNDRIYKNEDAKFRAIAQEVKERQKAGQPVLIGTISIEKNEKLSLYLNQEGIQHNILNAKEHAKEGEIIAQAGKPGAVTVATNMAGRGVDIILGGNPPQAGDRETVHTNGGLYVIGSERHESRRIDNQLRGRAGRQGDPGVTGFYVSLDDDLMRIFGGERIRGLMETLKLPDDTPIENKMITRSLEQAQKRVEGHNFDIRKRLVEYDDVVNKQRETIYKKRRAVLTGDRCKEMILESVLQEITAIITAHTADDDETLWDLTTIYQHVSAIFPLDQAEHLAMVQIRQQAGDDQQDEQSRDLLIGYLYKMAVERYNQFEQIAEGVNPEIMGQIERSVVLRVIDELWVEHLDNLSYLRHGIGLQGYGQRDPLLEYKKQAFTMFSELVATINHQVAHTIFKVSLQQAPTPAADQPPQVLQFTAPNKTQARQSGIVASVGLDEASVDKSYASNGSVSVTVDSTPTGPKVGRNELCPCGSGKKYKKCHGA